MNVNLPLCLRLALLAVPLLARSQAEPPPAAAVEAPAKEEEAAKMQAAAQAARAAAQAAADGNLDVQVQLAPGDLNNQGPVVIRAQGQARVVVQGGIGGGLMITGSSSNTATGLKPTPSSKPAEVHDVLEFLSGDRLRGNLEAVDPAALVWRHEAAADPIRFKLPALQAARLAPPHESAPAGREESLVHLTNDDTLSGTLISLDADKLLLDTWYGGTVSVRRAMVRRLIPNLKSQAVVYAGPDDLANWSTGERTAAGAWKLRGDTLVCYQQTPIGREIEGWPDRARIDFDVAWENYPGFNICFYADSLQIYNNNGYMLQVSGSSLYFRRQQRNKGATNLWNENMEKFNQSRTRKAAFSLLVDRHKASFTLLVDGEVVRQWTDSNGFAGEGKGIVLQPQAMGGMRFSNIRVSHWNGSVPDTESKPDPAQDHLDFINRDTVSGALLSIADGKAKVKSSYGDVDVPLDRISQVTLSQDKLERARRNKEDIRALFSGTTAVTFDLDRMDNGRLSGTSENFGAISVPLAALRQVEFNIYKKRAQDPVDEDEE